MERLGHAGWIGPGVGETEVHSVQARGRWVAEVAHLHGRRPVCKGGQSVAPRMASKIQENIDLISPHLLDECPVIPGRRRSANDQLGLSAAE